jgi:hypothetical protein
MIRELEGLYYNLRFRYRDKFYPKDISNNFDRQTYAGVKYYDINSASDFLAHRISEGKPFMAARFGSVELFAMRTAEFNWTGKENKVIEQLCTCAGFFPQDRTLLSRFNKVMTDACGQLDMLGVWYQCSEEYFIKKYAGNMSAVCWLGSLEPWYAQNPWTRALAGKKVLIIHPFEESIKNQLKNRDKLFENPQMLPECEFITLKAVQTSAGQVDDRFLTWFDALEYMCNQIDKTDFDIALIGCGAYGFPLAAHCKQIGKQAVHIGGALQLFFGIKGKRWDELEPDIVKMYNEYWDYPLDCETPKNHSAVEGGTYWRNV